ncbi:MAG: dihydrofolate reductase [Luteolibacter sp.]
MRLIGIAALATNRIIGFQGQLPWHLPEDLRHFRETTLENALILGSTTFEQMPLLDRRDVYVLTQRPAEVLHTLAQKRDALKAPKDLRVVTCASLEEALARVEASGLQKAFLGGGSKIYRHALGLMDELLLTRIQLTPIGDSQFPDWQADFRISEMSQELMSRNGIRFRFEHWERQTPKRCPLGLPPRTLGKATPVWQ